MYNNIRKYHQTWFSSFWETIFYFWFKSMILKFKMSYCYTSQLIFDRLRSFLHIMLVELSSISKAIINSQLKFLTLGTFHKSHQWLKFQKIIFLHSWFHWNLKFVGSVSIPDPSSQKKSIRKFRLSFSLFWTNFKLFVPRPTSLLIGENSPAEAKQMVLPFQILWPCICKTGLAQLL